MAAVTGLDRMVGNDFAALKGKAIGLLCNQASVDASLRHIVDLMLPFHAKGSFRLSAIFGPQHGPYGHTQDNMIEWEGYLDPRTSVQIVSLYGEHRQPTPEKLSGIELLVVDLQDVGARYYTFIWTMLLCFEACERLSIPVMVLDRPNPLGGLTVEGAGVEPGYESFVGLHSLPMRHGLTIGEIAVLLQRERTPGIRLDVVNMLGWSRDLCWDQTGLSWVSPSPNMPTPNTALVYPGMCLLEGSNLSEGRGTTHPFEWIGAPYLDSWSYADVLNAYALPGVFFRPAPFQPAFQKHAGQVCGGVFVHVLDAGAFLPVLTGIAALKAAHHLSPEAFAWKKPPYEYEEELMPIDVLAGGQWLREGLAKGWELREFQAQFAETLAGFSERRNLLYT